MEAQDRKDTPLGEGQSPEAGRDSNHIAKARMAQAEAGETKGLVAEVRGILRGDGEAGGMGQDGGPGQGGEKNGNPEMGKGSGHKQLGKVAADTKGHI